MLSGRPKVLVLRTAGTNCDAETAHACSAAGGDVEILHVNRFIRGERKLDDFHFLVIPGGFSYGDDVSAGRILANEIRFKLGGQLASFVGGGKPVLGICNGFQVLVKTGLLPGAFRTSAAKRRQTHGSPRPSQQATLFNNDSGRFECRWVYLRRAENTRCIFTNGLPEMIQLPVAHGEGKVMFDSEETKNQVIENGQAVFRYTDEKGRAAAGYPCNPNGSDDDIAGMCDPTGLIFGLMPHPERHVFTYQHPRWTRGEAGGGIHGDGFPVFRSAIVYAKRNL
ncbi:MAG: phosphoribosylformylglycinamidine synthase I [bacterium]